MRLRVLTLLGCVTLVVGIAPTDADERLEGKACRSVHLHYSAAEGVAFYNEVTVDQSAPGTYFCACGWDKGYFGIQELGNGKKLVIFSVWDSNKNNPKAVDDDKRVKLLHKDEKVRTGRFGGEGTGGQSFFDYDWKAGDPCRFLVAAKPAGDRTEYSGFFYAPAEKSWKHLVTFSTITGGKNLAGYYSFVEDFKRDRVSATMARSARFGNAWVKGAKGDWEAVTKAKFTADRNPVLTINAGVQGGRFFLTTGGETKNADTKLGDAITLPADEHRAVPDGLPALR